MSTTYTEEEFKKVLKNLFNEKKRVKELQKQFQQKLSEKHASGLDEDYAELKRVFLEKEEKNRALQEQLSKVKPALHKLVGELREAREEIALLKEKSDSHEVEELKEALAQAKEHEKQEAQRLETERSRLVERLAESLSQVQHQAESIKELRENLSSSYRQTEELKGELTQSAYELTQVRKEKERLEHHLSKFEEEWKRREAQFEQLHRELEQTQAHLQATDVSVVQEEYEAKLQQAYEEMRGFSKRHSEAIEAHEQLRKAQQHLAKKVKETTILQDLCDRQKTEASELQTRFGEQEALVEQLHNRLSMQKMHEEKVQVLAKEWQEKYLALYEEHQASKSKLVELQKMRKQYEQMSAAFSNLKNVLGETFELPPEEQL